MTLGSSRRSVARTTITVPDEEVAPNKAATAAGTSKSTGIVVAIPETVRSRSQLPGWGPDLKCARSIASESRC